MLIRLEHAEGVVLGGKGAALQRLSRRGMRVPPTWVIAPAEFDRWLNLHVPAGRPERSPGEELALAACLAAAPPPDWATSLTLPPNFPPNLAVRSSALDEDGRHNSAAGQYDTLLNVTPDGLGEAVKMCWMSAFSERAIAYRRGAAFPGMAVLVQQMIDARAAGVLFTINPINGSWREMTVEAVWGLGEGLVGGQLVPDRYTVIRPRRLPRPLQRATRLVPLRIARATVSRQAERVAPAREGGVGRREVDTPEAQKLGNEQIIELCRLGLRAEALQGEPQDVEWVQDRGGGLWLVQARAVTSRRALPRGEKTLWTRRFVGERWPEGVSHLGWGLLGPILEHFIAYPQTELRYLGGDPPFRRVGGHPYINATVFRHLAFKLPGRPPPQFMMEFFPADEQAAWLRRFAAPPDFRVYGSIFQETFSERRWERFRWNPFTNHRAWRGFLDTLDLRIAALNTAPEATLLDVATTLIRDYVKIHVTSLLFANLWYQVVSPLLPEGRHEDLLRAPEGTVTGWVNRELWRLGRSASPSALDTFLAAHGHRSMASWEIFSPRWGSDRAGVTRLAKLIAEGPDPGPALEEATRQSEAAVAAIRDPVVRSLVRLTRNYLKLREEQRYHFDRILAPVQARLEARAAAWLPDPRDVRFLLPDELDGGLGVAELRRTVITRAAEPVDLHPPDFLHGDEAVPAPRDQGGRLQGLGISAGVVRGRTRVLRTLADADQLRRGEILVARATDPSWTPLFSRAGGLILELGSMLSHGAVVAREYRIPGVVNLEGVTELLADGTDVTLDGGAGVVWVHR